MVRYAEPLDAIASLFGYSGTQPQLDEAWKYLNLNSAHDSIHGASVDEVHLEMEARYAAVRQIAAGLSHDALKHIAYSVDKENLAPFLPMVQSFLYPMMTHMVRSEQVGNAAGKEILPFVFLNDHVQFSSFKRSYDGDGFILRFYENQGKNVEAAVRLKCFNRVFMSNMNEEILQEIEMKDNTVYLNVGAYKVITLLLKKEPYAGL